MKEKRNRNNEEFVKISDPTSSRLLASSEDEDEDEDEKRSNKSAWRVIYSEIAVIIQGNGKRIFSSSYVMQKLLNQ